MGRRERLDIYDTGKEEENLIDELPPAHKLFFAVFRQAERDIEDFKRTVDSGKAGNILKSKGWTNELQWGYTNLKESIHFFSNRDGHLQALADCANVDLTSRRYKERIDMNLSIGRATQDQLNLLEAQIKRSEMKQAPEKKASSSMPRLVPCASPSPM